MCMCNIQIVCACVLALHMSGIVPSSLSLVVTVTVVSCIQLHTVAKHSPCLPCTCGHPSSTESTPERFPCPHVHEGNEGLWEGEY